MEFNSAGLLVGKRRQRGERVTLASPRRKWQLSKLPDVGGDKQEVATVRAPQRNQAPAPSAALKVTRGTNVRPRLPPFV